MSIRKCVIFSLALVLTVFLNFEKGSAQDTADLARFAEASGSTEAIEGNSVRILNTGPAFFDDLAGSISNAKNYILLEFFIFREDSISTRMLDLLSEKSRQGVKVYLIIDYLGCIYTIESGHLVFKSKPFSKSYIQPYLDSGISIAAYHSEGLLLPRDHRKVVVIDGNVAYTGGMNITDMSMGRLEGVGELRDMSIRVEGPAVKSMQDGFIKMWNICGDRPLEISRPENCTAAGEVPIILLETRGKKVHPTPEEIYDNLFDIAAESIQVINGYFWPTAHVNKAIRRAGQRGVAVQILIGSSTDMPKLLDRLLRKSALRLGKDKNITCHINPGGFHHEKVVLIDGQLVMIGSHNFDWLSIRKNLEISTLIDSPEIAAEIESYFDSCVRLATEDDRTL